MLLLLRVNWGATIGVLRGLRHSASAHSDPRKRLSCFCSVGLMPLPNIARRRFAIADFPCSLIELQRRSPGERGWAAYLVLLTSGLIGSHSQVSPERGLKQSNGRAYAVVSAVISIFVGGFAATAMSSNDVKAACGVLPKALGIRQ